MVQDQDVSRPFLALKINKRNKDHLTISAFSAFRIHGSVGRGVSPISRFPKSYKF